MMQQEPTQPVKQQQNTELKQKGNYAFVLITNVTNILLAVCECHGD